MTVPPWHLWGDAKLIEVPYTGIFSTTIVTGQLAKVRYNRPDTWSFMFWAQVQSSILAVNPSTVGQEVDLQFDLIVGIGRSMATLPAFETYKFVCEAGHKLDGQVIWSTNVHGPKRWNISDAASNIIDKFPAQDIQCSVRATYSYGETHGDTAQLMCYAGFAPLSHQRPDWFARMFSGGELGGT